MNPTYWWWVAALAVVLIYAIQCIVVREAFNDRLYALCGEIVNNRINSYRYYHQDGIHIKHEFNDTRLSLNGVKVYSSLYGWEDGITAETKRNIINMIHKLHHETKIRGELHHEGNFTKAELKKVHDVVNERLNR